MKSDTYFILTIQTHMMSTVGSLSNSNWDPTKEKKALRDLQCAYGKIQL